MAKSARRSTRVSPKARRRRAPISRRPARSSHPHARAPQIGPIVVWTEIPALVRALAAGARQSADAIALQRLVIGLTEPFRQLETMTALANRGLTGDEHAARELRASLAAIAARGDGVRALDAQLIGKTGHGDPCGCGCKENRPAFVGDKGDDARDEPPVIDQRAAVSLLLAVARVHVDQPSAVRDDALAATMSLAAAATTMAGLVSAHRSGGSAALFDELGRMGALGQLDWVGGPMQVRSGGAPGGFDIPLPGDLPKPGGVPGFPVPDDGEWIPKKAVDELLGWLKNRKRFDPEIWDHPYAFWRDPINYWDPKQARFIACMLEIRRKLNARAAIPPPARPARVTWADGITSITATGACVGDRIVIRGTGLLKPNTWLLLPFADGCQVVQVPPQDWTDTSITVTLPAGVISGPIGFGDASYITAYDTWAFQQNILAAEIENLFCYVGDIPWVFPFRECPPDIGVNRIRAGTAIIKSFTAAGGATAVVEPGGAVLLAWTVQNADQIRLDRISGPGPLFGASTSLVNPAGTTWSLGTFLHLSPGACVYRLTAIGPCGTVTRDVNIYASKRPNLSIGSIEVTQSIQTAGQTVPLVDRKPTVVRVTVRHGLFGFGTNTVPNVRGRIRVRRSDGSISGWIDAANGSTPMAPNPGASITVQANPQRNNTNDTLNFLIPPLWCTLSVRYEIEVRVVGFGATGGFAGFDQVVTLTSAWFAFQVRRTLEFRYIRVNWGGSTPTDAVCANTLRSAIPMLPTPTANIFALPGVGVQNPPGTANADRDNLLNDFDDRHNCSWWEALWEWLGEDCPDDDGAIWILIPGVFFRGRAFDIPSNVCFTPPNDGPYAAHEIAHCLNQAHVSVNCANGQTATGGDAPSAWPNNAQLQDVPFDVTRNQALTLAGTGVFDLMTYCGTPNNTWPIPARWDRLWVQIGS